MGVHILPPDDDKTLPIRTRLDPNELLAVPGLRIVDIREPHERQPPVGYIPSSRMFPMSLIQERPALLRHVYPPDAPLALTCMTGRRSAEMVPVVKQAGFRFVYDQVGGIFSWADAGLPLAGQNDYALDAPAPDTFAGVVSAMESCFVAAAIESDLDNDSLDPEFNPRTFVSGVVTQAINRYGPRVAALEHALDDLAEQARLRGHSLEMIAVNLDHMRALMEGLK